MISHKLLLPLTALAAGMLVLPLSAQQKTNFTGSWKLNTSKGNLPQGGPRSLVVTVEHKDPVLKYTANGETLNGESFTETVELTTDGKEHPARPELQGKVSGTWEGRVLVIRFSAESINLTQTAKVRLSADGKQMLRDVVTKSSQGESAQTEVYDKEQNP